MESPRLSNTMLHKCEITFLTFKNCSYDSFIGRLPSLLFPYWCHSLSVYLKSNWYFFCVFFVWFYLGRGLEYGSFEKAMKQHMSNFKTYFIKCKVGSSKNLEL